MAPDQGTLRQWTERFTVASGAVLVSSLLAVGVFLRALGTTVGSPVVGLFGVGLSILGALGYLYVLIRRFYV
jgi:hypothetical protein